MYVPFLDLRSQHDAIREQLHAALDQVIDRSAFAGGAFVEEFEQAFARSCGTAHAIGVSSGTDALWLALTALNVGPGDEVITVAATFFATAEAICRCGATPVFVDVDPETCTMDPGRVEAAITPRTRAIVPVHLYGQMADMDPLMELARSRGLVVVEDACQAHGAIYRGRKAGSVGDAGCFSFYPSKNLGALGEAGAVVTQDQALAERIRRFRDHGQTAKYVHREIGWNSRMDGIQGAFLTVKLRQLEDGNRARRVHAARYLAGLQGVSGLCLPVTAEDREHAYHLFVVRTARRDEVVRELTARGIGYGIHYPIPVHRQPAFVQPGSAPVELPVTEAWAREVLSLPIYPGLTASQVDAVIAGLSAAVGASLDAPISATCA